MDPKDAFEQQLLLFCAVTAATCASALGRAGLLDSEDRAEIDRQLALVEDRAHDVKHGSHHAWLSALRDLLPSP